MTEIELERPLVTRGLNRPGVQFGVKRGEWTLQYRAAASRVGTAGPRRWSAGDSGVSQAGHVGDEGGMWGRGEGTGGGVLMSGGREGGGQMVDGAGPVDAEAARTARKQGGATGRHGEQAVAVGRSGEVATERHSASGGGARARSGDSGVYGAGTLERAPWSGVLGAGILEQTSTADGTARAAPQARS